MKRICFTLCVVFLFTTAYMQNTIPKAQTLFIYNFALLTEWPQQYLNGPFVIGVIGESDIFSELNSYTADKRVGSQQIKLCNSILQKKSQHATCCLSPFHKPGCYPK